MSSTLRRAAALLVQGTAGCCACTTDRDRHPYPRTLAMSALRRSDTSVLDELPPGRTR
jgi:hypothetical protein